MMNTFIVLQMNTLAQGEKMCFALWCKTHSFSYTIVMNVLVVETNALKAHVQTSAPHSYTCSYHRFSSRASLEIANQMHSPSKTGSSHALVLAFEYATPTSYSVRNSILCWTKQPSS